MTDEKHPSDDPSAREGGPGRPGRGGREGNPGDGGGPGEGSEGPGDGAASGRVARSGVEDVDVGYLADVQAVIESASRRSGRESLERWIRERLPDAEDDEVAEAAEVAEEIIRSIPVFLARAHQEADARGMASLVGPLLEAVERYFMQPVDLIPEMTRGLAGLLDDAYLVIRMLQNLDKAPEPFLDWDLEYPLIFLRKVVGEDIARQLDRMAADALMQVSDSLSRVWAHLSHPA